MKDFHCGDAICSRLLASFEATTNLDRVPVRPAPKVTARMPGTRS